jgi:hypothetical protein
VYLSALSDSVVMAVELVMETEFPELSHQLMVVVMG